MKLRDALRGTLEGWENELPARWRTALGETQLSFDSPALDVQAHSGEIIIPRRKGKREAGSPRGAHILRAFEKVSPEDVRAVILGQEPYPNPSWATGRAFEQGDLEEWPENNRLIAASLRRMVQVLASARSRNRSYASGDRASKVLINDVSDGRLPLQKPRKLFDHLQEKGVLLLNTSLTVSVERRAGEWKRCRSHFRVWEPLLYELLRHLATRRTGHLVFMLWGGHAMDVFKRAGIRGVAESAGTWHRRVDVVRHAHPAAITRDGAVFFHSPNPFLRANEALKVMGAKSIRW